MRHLLALALMLLLLLPACGDCARDGASWTAAPEADDFTRAMSLAQPAYEKARQGSGDYKLIGMERLWTADAILWRATWKPEHLLPDEPDGLIGAGGEIFVTVNLATGETKHGYGE